jgi:23S rRNA G2445 N2-methylase RlmL
MAGSATIPIEAAGLAVGAAIRHPPDLPFRHLAAFRGLPNETPDLFPGTVPQILALDVDEEMIKAMVGNLRAAGLTGAAYKDSMVIGQKDVRALTPEYVASLLPRAAAMKSGVFCFNPPYGVRIGGESGEAKLLDLYAGMGRALARFTGWRAACFVSNPRFIEAFGHPPAMTKPATNAELPGAFLVYEL